MKKITLLGAALLLALTIACSADDSTPIEEPPTPVDMCNCLIKRYRVMTLYNGTPTDTIFMYENYRNTDNGLYQEACGTNRWQPVQSTQTDNNPFYYETENYVAGN